MLFSYATLIERFSAWAEAEPDVRAALVIGSRARSDHPADEWADLDVLVFALHPERFTQSPDWQAAVAPYLLTFVERAGGGETWERRTLYEGGLDVDLVFNPADWLDGLQKGVPQDFADFIRRGVKILVDKDGKLAQILSRPLPAPFPYQRPSEKEFLNSTSIFWYHTLWSAKHLRRGEIWWAKSCVDMYMKGLLQTMLEWHARATRGEGTDTWLRGRFLNEWADPRAVEELAGVFAHYNSADITRALAASIRLYRWLEDETAARWGYAPPVQGEEEAARLALRLLETI